MDRISELPTFWKEKDEELQKEFDELKLIDNNLVQFRNELKLGIQTWILLVRLMDVEGSSYLVNKWTALVVDVEGSSSLVDKWIGLAVENGVKELHIEVESSPQESAYTLPQAIYSAKLLTTLVLNGCRLDEPLIAINLNSLKNLSLQRVYANEQMVHNLIAECCSLEDLTLYYTLGLKFFSVSKAHKLKNMVIADCSRSSELESIVAPSLQQLTLMRVIVVATCPNLKKLYLSEIVLEDQEFHELISKFPLLEDLSVSNSQSLERVKFSSNLLKRVAFLFCNSLRAVDLDTPNLLSFTFESIRIPTISISASHQCLWNVFFVYEHDVEDIDNWNLKLKEFLGASNQIENLFINLRSVNIRQMPFDLEEFKNGSPSLPFQVGNMRLIVGMEVPIQEYKNLMDGIFRICYPKNLYLPKQFNVSSQFIEWLLELLWNRNEKCCKSCPIKCWRHYLKNTKTASFLPNGDARPINIDNWRDRLPMLPDGYLRERLPTLPDGTFKLNLQWCFPEHDA